MSAHPEGLSSELRGLAAAFLKLGTVGFGGPAAHIALMEDEVVRRRKWLSREEFLDLLGATNLIPGPNSTEMAIHLGHRRGGWIGLVVAGSCFILPAAIMVGALAWAYVRFGQLPQVGAALYGVKPVIIAVVLQALWGLGRTAIKSPLLAVLGMAAVTLALAGVNELLVLFGAGAFMVSVESMSRKGATARPLLALVPINLATATGAATAGVAAPVGLMPLFLFFLKVGSVLFGSGYVLLAFLRADLVDRWHWLTEAQLLDAIAVGQVTPGPVFTTATFIGYLLAGTPGAAVATVGIFLPAFFFVAISGPLVPRLRRSRLAGAFLDGVNVASMALMAAVTWHLARSAVVDVVTVALAVVSLVLLLRFRINPTWLVLGGGAVGGMVQLFQR
jgi:chromate transporter